MSFTNERKIAACKSRMIWKSSSADAVPPQESFHHLEKSISLPALRLYTEAVIDCNTVPELFSPAVDKNLSNPLIALPSELHGMIFSHLDHYSIYDLHQTCHDMKAITRCHVLRMIRTPNVMLPKPFAGVDVIEMVGCSQRWKKVLRGERRGKESTKPVEFDIINRTTKNWMQRLTTLRTVFPSDDHPPTTSTTPLPACLDPSLPDELKVHLVWQWASIMNLELGDTDVELDEVDLGFMRYIGFLYGVGFGRDCLGMKWWWPKKNGVILVKQVGHWGWVKAEAPQTK
ncbi:hypothetical protein G7K_4126-t1 [Saitoella complicata NRRL Y-17804]|uniref:F-box domain-containing protein n=2 Tax=Saitoella complicata (strain BCRC 22490 / CBS 7301 / JCM 7358 / NBRC 10748 / NRRL Y-17804) TaxID=698492 RepID=A0A0E9NJY2_SAICN|nr:hypothetical protein G7K_4126-t1 [Saitoella complicata NRRL Y-17804]